MKHTQEFIEDLFLSQLSFRARKILKMRFGSGCLKKLSWRAIGEKFNVSGTRATQIAAKSLRVLKRLLCPRFLQDSEFDDAVRKLAERISEDV